MKIIDIVARWPGSAHDATIFQNSRLRYRLEDEEFHMGLILGDNGYANTNYLLTPLLHPITAAETRYNNIHIRTRNIVERVFGVWKRRFPVLSLGMSYSLPLVTLTTTPSVSFSVTTGMRVMIETVQAIIVATAILHNMARDNNEEQPPDCADLNEEIGNNNENQVEIGRGDNYVRQRLINEYFSR